MKKIIFISLSLAISLTACNAPVSSVAPEQTKQLNNSTVIDLAKDLKNNRGGQVSVSINDILFNTKTLAPSAPGRIKDIKSYKVGLCTNPTSPLSSALTGSPKIVLRDGDVLAQPHTVTFINVPPGTYYAVVQAMGANNKNITETNTTINTDAYVSTNSITVNSDFSLTPSSGILNVAVNLISAKPGTENFNFSQSVNPLYFMPSLSVNSSDKGLSAGVSSNPSGFANIYIQKIQGFNPVDNIIPASLSNTTQITPSVSINSSGNGLIAWVETSGASTIIKAVKILNYDISGSAFTVSSATGTVNQLNPSVSINANGDGLVVWEDYRNSNADIYGKKITNYSIDSIDSSSADLAINQSLPGNQLKPKVSVNSSGTGLVAWIDTNAVPLIYSRKISSFGPNGSESFLDNGSDYVSLSTDDSGNGLITWKKSNDIYASKLSNFNILTPFKVSDSSSDNKANPEVSINSSGFGMVIWEDYRENNVSHIYGKEIKSYAPFGVNDLRISSEDGTNIETKPAININNMSNGMVIWSNNSNQLKSRHIIKLLPFSSIVSNVLSGKLPQSAGLTDGVSSVAQYSHPEGMSVDSSGNLFVADTNNHRIRKILPDGSVTTFAGTTAGFNDGPNTGARFNTPEDVAIDSSGNIYVADSGNSAIRKISTSGTVTTIANSSAGLVTPKSVTVDLSGNLYVADSGTSTIKKISSLGVVTTLAGGAGAGYADGTGTNSKFNGPVGIDLNKDGNLYVTDTLNNAIRKINLSDLSVTTLAGTNSPGDTDGFGTLARFNNPTGITTDSKGFIYISDFNNHKVKRISLSGYVTTLAGSTPGFANGDKNTTLFNYTTGIAVKEVTSPNSFIQMYVADWNNNLIRSLKVD